MVPYGDIVFGSFDIQNDFDMSSRFRFSSIKPRDNAAVVFYRRSEITGADCSRLMASIKFDLPHPLGPTKTLNLFNRKLMPSLLNESRFFIDMDSIGIL